MGRRVQCGARVLGNQEWAIPSSPGESSDSDAIVAIPCVQRFSDCGARRLREYLIDFGDAAHDLDWVR
jgi:hypothetical protein